MAKAEPIRQGESLERLKNYFLEKEQYRNYALVVLGTNTIFRINDILKLRWGQVYDFEKKEYRKEIRIARQSDGNEDVARINTEIIKALEAVKLDSEVDCRYYIFRSRKGENQPISRTRAFTIIKEAARELGIEENISCQSLRKTFGYQAWRQGVKLEYLQAAYGQYSREKTREYLGIEEKEKEKPVIEIQV